MTALGHICLAFYTHAQSKIRAVWGGAFLQSKEQADTEYACASAVIFGMRFASHTDATSACVTFTWLAALITHSLRILCQLTKWPEHDHE